MPAVAMGMFLGLGATLAEDKVGVSFDFNFVFRKGGTDGKLRGDRKTHKSVI